MSLKELTISFVETLKKNDIRLVDFYNNLLNIRACDRIKMLTREINYWQDSLPNCNWFNGKDDEKSLQFRKTGNEYFVRMAFVESLRYYNKAIAFANSKRNLAICYANRSAVFFELSLFDICLEDIMLARTYDLPHHLLTKLDHRQNKATEQALANSILKPTNMKCVQLSRPPFIANYLKSLPLGDIKTIEALDAGETISAEAPYSQILKLSHIYERCTYCLSNQKYMALIPCKCCTMAMFCNDVCYANALEMFHKIECPIIDGLFEFLPEMMYLGLRTVLMGLYDSCSISTYRELLKFAHFNESESFNADFPANITNRQKGFLDIHKKYRSFTCNLAHHVATAVVIEQLKLSAPPLFESHPSTEILLTTSLFHMMQICMENSILLEEFGLLEGVFADARIYACGMYPFASVVKQSCEPNVIFLNRSGMLSAIVLRPIAANGIIKPGITSMNHFLNDRDYRLNIWKEFTNQLCHCLACRCNYKMSYERDSEASNLTPFPIKIPNFNNTNDAFQRICHYLNHNRDLVYLSWEMGMSVTTMIYLMRQMSETNDIDTAISIYSKFSRDH